MKMIKNSKGISLVEVIIAGAIMMGASLGVMRILDNISGGQNRLTSKSERVSFSNNIRSFLANKDNCEATMYKVFDDESISVGTTVDKNMIYYQHASSSSSKVYVTEKGFQPDRFSRFKYIEYKILNSYLNSITNVYDAEVEARIHFEVCKGGNKPIYSCPANKVSIRTDVIKLNVNFNQTRNNLSDYSCITSDDPILQSALSQSCENVGGVFEANDCYYIPDSCIEPTTGKRKTQTSDNCPLSDMELFKQHHNQLISDIEQLKEQVAALNTTDCEKSGTTNLCPGAVYISPLKKVVNTQYTCSIPTSTAFMSSYDDCGKTKHYCKSNTSTTLDEYPNTYGPKVSCTRGKQRFSHGYSKSTCICL